MSGRAEGSKEGGGGEDCEGWCGGEERGRKDIFAWWMVIMGNYIVDLDLYMYFQRYCFS